jgi:hypothetical protein
MTTKEFNEKYSDFLEEGHYGLAINDDPGVINFLDKIFEDLTRIPGFKFYQIKLKFGFARFYAKEISSEMQRMVENGINDIFKKS